MHLLLSIAFVHFVALAVPGPDFFVVAKAAIRASRRAALLTAMGVTGGIMVWAGLALLGLNLLFERVVWLQAVIRMAGGAYLLYLGFLMFRSSWAKPAFDIPSGAEALVKSRNSFRGGLLTNLANPKAAVYFGSIFATFLTPATSTLEKVGMFTLVSVESAGWFLLVGVLFSLPAPRRLYSRASQWIDRVAGAIFASFGLRLLLTSRA